MAIIKLQNQNLVLDTPYTVLAADTASGQTALSVKNMTGFAANQIIILGNLGGQGSEVVSISGSPSGNVITSATTTIYAHGAGTPVRVIQYNQVEFSNAATVGGSKSVLATIALAADNDTTNYIDTSGSTGYYFGRFKNSITSAFSGYSDPIPVAGYGLLSARTIIDKALSEINKTTSSVLTDAFAFSQIDNCQTEVLRELKRWSFMQKFNAIIGTVSTGSWKVLVPTDLDDQNTNKTIYNLRLAGNPDLIWVDKEKFDALLADMLFTTLAATLNVGDSTMTLSNSSGYTATGSVQVGAYTYAYTANDTTTGILTLSALVPANEGQSSGADVFQNIQTGLPGWWTIFGGYIWYLPVTDATYNGLNLYLDYYTKQSMITSDSVQLVIPDPMVAVYYLCEKFLIRLANGDETDAAVAYHTKFQARLDKMKQKETLGRTFILKPRYQNFAQQSVFDDGDPRWIRDGRFPNTGF